jgi:hypothetical protein
MQARCPGQRGSRLRLAGEGGCGVVLEAAQVVWLDVAGFGGVAGAEEEVEQRDQVPVGLVAERCTGGCLVAGEEAVS